MKFVDAIDNYFYKKSLKDTFMVYLIIILVLGFSVFYFILSQAQKYRNAKLKLYNDTKTQLQVLKAKKKF